MHEPLPPLNALRAFEAAARHLSLTRAAAELHVTPGALSHQIRGLEEFLGVKLFNRGVRSISLTREGQLLLPGLQIGFVHIRDAVAAVRARGDTRVLVVTTPPGFTAKWLAPRLYKFAAAHPDIDARVTSSHTFANFKTDGVDIAIRTLPVSAATDPDLAIEKLIAMRAVPVCSPKLLEAHGSLSKPHMLARAPLIHDDNRGGILGWAEWFKAAGVDGVDLSRGLRFNSADHALEAVVEGAGVFLSHDVLAHDDLRTGRLVAPCDFILDSGYAYHFVCMKARQKQPNVEAFRSWLHAEVAAMDGAGQGLGPRASGTAARVTRKRSPRA